MGVIGMGEIEEEERRLQEKASKLEVGIMCVGVVVCVPLGFYIGLLRSARLIHEAAPNVSRDGGEGRGTFVGNQHHRLKCSPSWRKQLREKEGKRELVSAG